MVQRKRFEAPGDYSIAVASERMKDGQWSAVTTIQQSTQTGERNIDLPISDARFATEEEAENVRGEPRARVDREERAAFRRDALGVPRNFFRLRSGSSYRVGRRSAR